ncbi:uncharacterized protein LOC128332868 isoform X1 [Hemicordylus capensis]|uniref:uncharacterized protein LOC128332868 isoform X1 n=1 Tax=Hemicordylus capensis TaxID=884348 RepID=UPI002304C803|nr:uncharacterized protein LOC128332868 isoform X1 [Hemicordylus capensis]
MGREGGHPSHRWGLLGWKPSWQATFLAVSSLSACCFLLPEARDHPSYLERIVTIPIKAEPAQPRPGGNVILLPVRGGGRFAYCRWFQAEGEAVLANLSYKERSADPSLRWVQGQLEGRASVDSRCSLHIWNLTLQDAGIYVVEIYSQYSRQRDRAKRLETGYTDIGISDAIPPSSGLTPPIPDPLNLFSWITAGFIVSSLAVVVILGALLHGYLCNHQGWSNVNSTQAISSTTPVSEEDVLPSS